MPVSTSINSTFFPDELAFLNGLFKRSYQLVYGKEPYIDLWPDKQGQILIQTDHIRVALISFKLPRYETSKAMVKSEKIDYHEEDYWAVRYDKSTFDPQIVFDALDKVMKYHDISKGKPINYILFNELAISVENHNDVLTKIQTDYVNKYNIFFIPGSFHCNMWGYNVAPVLGPNVKEYSLKQNPAIHEGEQIRTLSGRRWKLFKSIHGFISVWICLDLYDPSLVLKLLANNMRLSDIKNIMTDLIFIPSCNTDSKDKINTALKFISRMTGTAVFLANGSFEKTGWIYNIGYYLGNKLKMKYFEKTDQYKISIFDVKWGKHKEEQHKPFLYSHSSLFNQIIGAQPYSLQNIPE